MDVAGRNGEPIRTMDEWRDHGGPASEHHWQPGRSAMELAADWIQRDAEARATDLVSRLESVSSLKLLNAIAEKKTDFDGFGGPRNHDLLVNAEAAAGHVTIAIEGKADEPFDDPLWLYREKALKRSARTNALKRVDTLVEAWFQTTLRNDRKSPPLITIGFQLFSALAGALADAKTSGSVLTVLLVQEFVTDRTSDDLHERNAAMFDDFLQRLLGARQHRLGDKDAWITRPVELTSDGTWLPVQMPVAFAKIRRELRS